LDIDARSVADDAARVTLAGLLTSMAVLGLLMGGMFGTLEQGQRAYALGAARVEGQQNARIAVARLAREIRTAGAGVSAFDAISVAEPHRVVLHRDVDGNGVIAGAAETTTWRLSGATLRRDAGGGAQPVVDGVEQFVLTYFDASGAPTSSPGDVRAIAIVLTTRPQHAVSREAGDATFTVSTHVRLRNR
jgi:type II secretory pathway component PulJ